MEPETEMHRAACFEGPRCASVGAEGAAAPTPPGRSLAGAASGRPGFRRRRQAFVPFGVRSPVIGHAGLRETSARRHMTVDPPLRAARAKEMLKAARRGKKWSSE